MRRLPTTTEAEPSRSSRELRRLFDLTFRHYAGRAAVPLLFTAASAAASGALAWTIRRMIDQAGAREPVPEQMSTALLVFAVMAVMAASEFGLRMSALALAERLTAELRSRMLAAWLDTSYARTLDRHRGEVSTWLINDLDQVKLGILRLSTSLVRDPLVALVLFGCMLVLDPVLSMPAVLVTGLMVLPSIGLGRRTRRLNRRMLDDLGRVTSFHGDVLAAVRSIKTFAAEEDVAGAYAGRNENLRRSFLRVAFWGNLSEPLSTIGIGLLLLAIVQLGIGRIHAGLTSPGTLVAFLSSLLLFSRPASGLVASWNGIQASLGATSKVFDLLDLEPESGGGRPVAGFERALTLDKVGFSYQGREPVLRSIDLEIPKGRSVAIIGPNGSGKSTLIGILCGLLQPQTGSVRLDGCPVGELELRQYRRLFAFISAESELFADSVRNNVALWNPAISPAEVDAALRAVGLGAWLDSLADGLDTLLGPAAVEPSRGQKQRLCLARAFVRRAQILVLDEATEGLDSRTLAQIDDSARRWLGQFTVVLVTHRVTFLERFDSVLVLDEGRIVERGSHAELLAAAGLYSELHEHFRRHQREARIV